MSDKELKRYQENAVDELILKSKLLLKKDLDDKTIVFKAPTGSGKTFMMSQFIKQAIEEFKDDRLCFLWISIGKGSLHIQSYESLSKEFEYAPPVYLLEQEFFGSRKEIDKNEVVVVNWEKLNQKDSKTGEWKSNLMKDKETTNFRELVRNTKEEKIKIIMIIDESHASATAERAIEVREIIKADLIIEMSATPILKDGEYNEKVEVEASDVISEGMIKKEIIVMATCHQLKPVSMITMIMSPVNCTEKKIFGGLDKPQKACSTAPSSTADKKPRTTAIKRICPISTPTLNRNKARGMSALSLIVH